MQKQIHPMTFKIRCEHGKHPKTLIPDDMNHDEPRCDGKLGGEKERIHDAQLKRLGYKAGQ